MLSMYKALGIILVISSGLITSRKILAESKKDLSKINALIELVSNFMIKIESLCIPIPEILTDIAPEILIKCGYDPAELPKDSEGLLEKCSFKYDKQLYGMYSAFLKSLGKGYKNEEIAKCRIFCEEIKALSQKKADEYRNKRKTVPALCISFSLGTVILLI